MLPSVTRRGFALSGSLIEASSICSCSMAMSRMGEGRQSSMYDDITLYRDLALPP